jgi:hypothetical protein
MSDAVGPSESPVLVEVRGHVAVITLNRPDPQKIVDQFEPEFAMLSMVTLMLPWGEMS